MNILHKSRNVRKVREKNNNWNQDQSNSSPTVDRSEEVSKSPSLTREDSDTWNLLSPALKYEETQNNKKYKNILPKRSLVLPSQEGLVNQFSGKYCEEPYYTGNNFIWNTMINNLKYEKTVWPESNWRFEDWNGVGSDLTTNSGTVNSLNEEKNSDIFQNSNNGNSNDNSTNSSKSSKYNNENGNRTGNFINSKSLLSDGTKNDSTAETTPETMVTNNMQNINLSTLKDCQLPSLLKSFKNVNSYLNNHPPLFNKYYDVQEEKYKKNKEDNTCKEKEHKGGRTKKDKDINIDNYIDFNNITQSNTTPVTMKVYTSWNGDGENTTSVKKSEKVQLVARSGNWIYVRVNSNPNRYGWIPEYTLLESELLSRKMISG